MGASRAEAIPCTTSFVSTDRATEAARAPSNPKGSSKTSSTRTGKPRPASREAFYNRTFMPGVRSQTTHGFCNVFRDSFGIWGCVATRQLAVQPTSSHTGAVTDFRPRDSESSPIERTVSTKGFSAQCSLHEHRKPERCVTQR